VRARQKSPRLARAALTGAAVAVLWGTLAARPAAAYSNGETVHLTGEVSDAQGRPVPGLLVTLSASRSYWSVRRMRSAEASPRTVRTTTDERGRYALDWPWDDYYNRFELQAVLPVRRSHGDEVEVLAREDVSERLTGQATGSLAGSSEGRAAEGPVITPLKVRDADYVRRVRRFVAGLASADERRVYDEMGHPDEVKEVRYPDHDEVSWWYFESGKAYRFEGGTLAQVVPFDPVKPF
jgi:hypothetical protein